MFFPCFIPKYDAVLHARIIAKRDCPFLLLPDFGRITRPHTPHFSSLYTPKLHLCTLVPLPGTLFPHIPNHHLGCPSLPFGISHFIIWGIPFCLLGYIFGTFAHNVQPRCPICLLRFRCQSLYVFFPFGSLCFFGIHLAG